MKKNIKKLLLACVIILIISNCQKISPLVGKWELVNVNNPPFGGVAKEIEYFSDGTGRLYSDIFGGFADAFIWSAEGGRLKFENYGIIQILDYEISGPNLIFYYNKSTDSYSVYKKVR